MRPLLVLFAASGCFYVDPINQRPSADIIQDSSLPVARGEQFMLGASVHDAEGQAVTVSWRIYACTDATAPAGCDPKPYYDDQGDMTIMPTAKAFRDDTQTPTQALRVILEAQDSQGATAFPAQLLIPLTDAPPTLQVDKMCRYGCVVGTPIDFFAVVDDADDTAARVHVAWQVYPAPGATFTLTPVVPNGQRLVPSAAGNWEVDVTATDTENMTVTQPTMFQVVPDHPPCLASWAPSTPPAGQTLPMHDPTLFEILVVQDDLDPYPPVPGDSLRGSPTFSWSLLAPGAATRTPLPSVIGNNVALDPSAYNPGDVLELRVEIQDRNQTPVSCADSAATCSVISDPTCIQRLTWTVQVQ